MERLEQVLAQDTKGTRSRNSKADLTPKEKTIFEPVMRLLMYAVCSLLEVSESIMDAQLFTAAFRKKVTEMKGSKPASCAEDDHVNRCMDIVHANLANLGKFLHKAAYQETKTTQDAMGRAASMCRGSFMRCVKQLVDNGQDKIGTDLTIDLYTSHYDLDDHFVSIKTTDLLNLSNALWLFHADENGTGPVIDDPESDRVFQLLCKIQPPDVDEAEQKKREVRNPRPEDLKELRLVSRVWKPHEILNTGDRQDVLHNLVISHRFLETQREMCFCRQCDAPVPRNVAPKDQRFRTEKRLLQVYRADQGPKMEGKTPFMDLEGVVAGLPHTGPLLKSKEFTQMKFEFEDLQKASNQKGKTGDFDLLDLIEKGKRALDLVRNHPHYQFKDFIEYLIKTYTDRVKHKRYLHNLEEGTKEIKKVKSSYNTKVKAQLKILSGVVYRSSMVQIPQTLKNVATENGVKLRFLDVEKVKKKEDKKARDFVIGGELELRPSGTFSIYQLIAKKVVRRLNVPSKQYQNISMTFNLLENSDWEVITTHKERNKSHMLCNFVVTNTDLEKMKRAGKTEKREFNEGFVVMSCFSLLQLLARVRASDIRV